MMRYVSKTGLALGGIFLLISLYLILTQGLFGESFIALILGIPWVFMFSAFEFFNPQSEAALGVMLLLPILLNTALFYCVGILIEWVYNVWAAQSQR